MIKEIHKKRIDSPATLMIYVILATVIIVLFSTAAGEVRRVWHIQHPEYLIFVCIALVCARVIRRLVTEYHYTLIDDELVFERFFGRKMEERVTISLAAISQYCLLNDFKNAANLSPRKFCHHHKKNRDIYAITFEQNNKRGLLYIHPTQEFRLGLQKAYIDVADRKTPGAFYGDYIEP